MADYIITVYPKGPPPLRAVAYIDSYSELLWVDRYMELGEVTLTMSTDTRGLEYIEAFGWLEIEESDVLMMIENIEYDNETNKVVVTGSSAEVILKWRVLQDDLSMLDLIYPFDPSFLITEVWIQNFRNDSEPKRKLSNVYLRASPDLSAYVPTSGQWSSGTHIYTIVLYILRTIKLGITAYREPSGALAWKVLMPEDRSTSQNTNPPVIFSEDYENIINSSLIDSSKDSQNIILAHNVEAPESRPALEYFFWYDHDATSEPESWDRREGFLRVESSNIDYDYFEELYYVRAKVVEHIRSKTRPYGVFDGDYLLYGIFKFGVDYFLGDYVQCVIRGKNTKAQIVERIIHVSESGVSDTLSFNYESAN